MDAVTGYAVVTGCSRGLGRALVDILLAQQRVVFGIARTDPNIQQAGFHFYQADLVQLHEIDAALQSAFKLLEQMPISAPLMFIHNAAVLEPIDPMASASLQCIDTHFRINLIAPAYLSAAWLRHIKVQTHNTQVVFISSGAARTAYAGWGCYCASKAALNHLAAVLAVEHAEQHHIYAVAPGIIDTDMQASIRAASSESFPAKERFVQLKETGALQTPEYTAQRLLDWLAQHPKSGCYDADTLTMHEARQ